MFLIKCQSGVSLSIVDNIKPGVDAIFGHRGLQPEIEKESTIFITAWGYQRLEGIIFGHKSVVMFFFLDRTGHQPRACRVLSLYCVRRQLGECLFATQSITIILGQGHTAQALDAPRRGGVARSSVQYALSAVESSWRPILP